MFGDEPLKKPEESATNSTNLTAKTPRAQRKRGKTWRSWRLCVEKLYQRRKLAALGSATEIRAIIRDRTTSRPSSDRLKSREVDAGSTQSGALCGSHRQRRDEALRCLPFSLSCPPMLGHARWRHPFSALAASRGCCSVVGSGTFLMVGRFLDKDANLLLQHR